MTTRLHPQRGTTLVEALVGLLILSLGLLGALRLQSWLRLNGELAGQRSEAVRLAQQDMEQVRGFADAHAFSEIASQRDTTHPAFALARTVTAQAALKSSHVVVSWPDRSGAAHSVRLHTHIAGVAPVYSAVLMLPSQDAALAPRRHLPPAARRLTAGRSLFKPSPHGSVAWILDSATGATIAQCSVPPGLPMRDITEADLGSCSDRVGVLIRGYIRFSLGPQPDASHPNDAPLALTLAPAGCETDTVRGAERYVAYVCFVPQGGLGSVPLRIVPEGWAFGATASTYKACRYAAAPLNYLVIRGDTSCPAAVPQHNEASVATLPYQP